jgi:hypothetical protein
VNSIGPRIQRCPNDNDTAQIAVGRRAANANCLIRHLNMQSLCVCIRVNCNRFNALSPRRADNPARDFSAIGYE